MNARQKFFIENLPNILGREPRVGEIAILAARGYSIPDNFMAAYDEAQNKEAASVYLGFFGLNDRSEFLKVGVAKNVRNRMADHSTGNPMFNVLTVSAQFQTRSTAFAVEQALLKHLIAEKTKGEWVHCKASIPACRAIAESLAEVAAEIAGHPVAFTES